MTRTLRAWTRLFETGDWKGAAPEFEAAVARAPQVGRCQFSLRRLRSNGSSAEAMEHLDICSASIPHYAPTFCADGFSRYSKGGGGVPNLQKAVEVQPESREAHLFSGGCL